MAYGDTLNKPLVLADGPWLLTVDWLFNDKSGAPERKKGAHLYQFSADGKSFENLGSVAIKESIFSEHMVVERNDKSLWMLVRTTYGIAQAKSGDGGKTWTELDLFTRNFGVNTRFFFHRLNSGNLLLVVNDHPKRRGNLTAMLSKDDGKTWPFKLVLDERDSVSYPDGVEGGGFIYVIYDHGRYLKDKQEILLAKVTEADIEAGRLVNPASYLKQTVNKLADEGGGVHFDGETTAMREEYVKLNADSPEAKKQMKAEDGEKADAGPAKAATP